MMGFIQAGINCDEDWDKMNLRMPNDNLTTIDHSELILNLESVKETISIDETNQQLIQSSPNNRTDNGFSVLFNNLLDVLFNSQLDEKGKIVPRVMQLFDLKDAFLFRTISALTIFTILTRIMSYYIIKYKANLRG